jgi:hypothetical protein
MEKMEPNPKVKKVSITINIEYKDGTTHKADFEYEQVYISQKRGLKKYRSMSTGRTEHISPNGHGLLELTAWKGCMDPSLFVANEEVQYSGEPKWD